MFELYTVVLFVFVLFLVGEQVFLNHSLRKIPLRIFVNGTRGKSTTVRILYEIFRNSGKNVYAKTTGDQPQIFFPDGRTKILNRFAPPSIIENFFLLIRWAKQQPDAVIMECMALQPETQNRLGKFMFKATHTLITNILPDHQEVMGKTLDEAYTSIMESVPHNSVIFMNQSVKNFWHTAPTDNKNLRVVPQRKFLREFEYIPHNIINQSWSLIAESAEFLQFDESIVHNAFSKAWQQINQNIHSLVTLKRIHFYNLFSTNDITSAKQFIKHYLKKEHLTKSIFFLNCRADRPLRTKDFILFLQEYPNPSEIWLTGDGRQLAYRLLHKTSSKHQVTKLSFKTALIKIKSDVPENAVLFGIGNHRGSESFILEMKALRTFLNGED